MTAGDLRFYRSSGSLMDTLIAATTGPFVHVDIELNDGSVIGELSSGLTRYTPPALPDGRVVVYPTAQHVPAASLNLAMAWAGKLMTMEGKDPRECHEYGLSDLFDALTHKLFAAAPVVGDPQEWDCSDFATRFCVQAGVSLPDALTQEPRTVTPSALAAALGV